MALEFHVWKSNKAMEFGKWSLIFHGFSMDFPWIFHGFPMDFHRFSIGFFRPRRTPWTWTGTWGAKWVTPAKWRRLQVRHLSQWLLLGSWVGWWLQEYWGYYHIGNRYGILTWVDDSNHIATIVLETPMVYWNLYGLMIRMRLGMILSSWKPPILEWLDEYSGDDNHPIRECL